MTIRIKGGLGLALVAALSWTASAVTLETDPDDYGAVRRAAVAVRRDIDAAVPGHAADTRRIVVGTLGRSQAIAEAVRDGRVDVSAVEGRWEASVRTYRDGVWYVVGSDRRGTIYALYDISAELGVSPTVWWDDVPVTPKASFSLDTNTVVTPSPAVKYRGVFLSGEDWGLRPWAVQNFEQDGGGTLGPKTYGKIYEALLRMKLNLLWPAMRAGKGASEFSAQEVNLQLADEMGVVIGSSPGEALLRNPNFWREDVDGRWDWETNRDGVLAAWKQSVARYGAREILWTVDADGTSGRPLLRGDLTDEERRALRQSVFAAQTNLLATLRQPVGLLVCADGEMAAGGASAGLLRLAVDDNYGHVRPLPHGASAVFWHASYFGPPRSVAHLATVSPATMWYELGERCVRGGVTGAWVMDVGDFKPCTVQMQALGELAWTPSACGPDFQRTFLRRWAQRFLGAGPSALAERLAAHLDGYYALAALRRPETMNTYWAQTLAAPDRAALLTRYAALLAEDEAVEAELPEDRRAAWFGTVGYQVRYLAAAGRFFVNLPPETHPGFAAACDEVRAEIAALDARMTQLADGKWAGFWLNTLSEESQPWYDDWSSAMMWPWIFGNCILSTPTVRQSWREADALFTPAAKFIRRGEGREGGWREVPGLGPTAGAVALLPVESDKGDGAWLEWEIPAAGAPSAGERTAARLVIRFLPGFRLRADGHLRVKVRVNGGEEFLVDVPEPDGALRSAAVQDGFVEAEVRLTRPGTVLRPGTNVVRLTAVDPGVTVLSLMYR